MRSFIIIVLFAICEQMLGMSGARAEPVPGQVERQIPAPRLTIYPGDEITESMLVMTSVHGARDQRGMAQEMRDVVGHTPRRTLLSGRPIPRAALRKKQDVVQGRQYKLVYQDAYLSIVATGTALQSAAIGDVINARNPDTGVVVRARVARDLALIVNAP